MEKQSITKEGYGKIEIWQNIMKYNGREYGKIIHNERDMKNDV